jgi:transformation/transcription domain-associated protein
MHSLEVLAKVTNKTVTEIMEPCKDVLQDMIPPKKHLLRHQPANAQIGLMVSLDLFLFAHSTEQLSA